MCTASLRNEALSSSGMGLLIACNKRVVSWTLDTVEAWVYFCINSYRIWCKLIMRNTCLGWPCCPQITEVHFLSSYNPPITLSCVNSELILYNLHTLYWPLIKSRILLLFKKYKAACLHMEKLKPSSKMAWIRTHNNNMWVRGPFPPLRMVH